MSGAGTADGDTAVVALANGVRVLTLRMPHTGTATVSVFVRTGSAHESKALNGISHLAEHMVFKGTAGRDARRINLDAERLGAEVNAHTDKDHTAFHMRGLARDALPFVRMLGDIVLQPTFPPQELERERQVLLHECSEDEDDPLSTAFALFDRNCFGEHPAAQQVMGPRRNIERFTRDALAGYVQRQYTGANLVVGVAGPVDADAVLREVQAVFGSVPQGRPNVVAPAPYVGGSSARALAGVGQAHLVLGYPLPPLARHDAAATLAATLFGDGMSSPLLDQLREQRGLAYYVACSADVLDVCGQFVIEASTGAAQVDELLAATLALLHAQAEHTDPVDLERARNQWLVRRLRDREHPGRRLEEAALRLFADGRVMSAAEERAQIEAVGRDAMRSAFQRLLAAGPSLALAGKLARGAADRARRALGA